MNYFLLPYELLVTSFRKFIVESRKYNYYFINMEKNLFVCYSREDYEFVASFELEFIRAKNNSTIASSNNLQIELQIDKNPGVISLGDKYQEKIEKIIQNSHGSILFISKNSAKSEFINKIEIPKILEIKKRNPNYIILPIFIDDAVEADREILKYQAPNSQNSALRNLSGDIKSLVYEKFVNDLFKNMVELEPIIEVKPRKEVNKKSLFSKKNIGFFSIILLGFFYTVLTFRTDTIQENNVLTEDPIIQSCSVFENYYKDIETLYDEDFLNTLNNSVEIWNAYINFYDSEEYRNFNASQQKEYHVQNGLYTYEEDKKYLEEIIIMIEVLGLEDVAEEHVELKRLLTNTQQLAILNIQNGISHIETYIEYRENIENYYQQWDASEPSEIDKVEQSFNEIDKELYERREQIISDGNSLEQELNIALVNFNLKNIELCG